jgi:hypothetical protein
VRAGLVEDDDVGLSEPFERFGIPEQDPVLCALPGADHDRRRRGEPEGARAGDDQDGDRVHERQVEGGLRPDHEPGHERQAGQPEDHRDEDTGDRIRQALDGGSRPLGFLDEAHDLGEHRLRAHPGGLVGEGPRAIERPPDDLVAGLLADGHALAGDHALVDRGAAVGEHPVDRDLLTGSHADEVAAHDLLDRDVELHAVADHARRPRGKPDELADCVRRVASGTCLEEAPEQDEGDDRRRRVEVEGKRRTLHAEAGRPEEPGERDGAHAVHERGARSHGDERVHVRRPVA